MPALSLCMIVKDEERFLAACLSSVRGSVDEIVVVDTGSSDGTRAIAEQGADLVIDFEWRDDFAAARNAGLERASGTHILVLDADERLASGASKALRRAIADARLTIGMLPLHDASELEAPIDAVVRGEKRLQAPTWLPRLFRNDPRLRYERRVHETLFRGIAAKLAALGGEILPVEAPIAHYGEVKALRAELGKPARNTRLLELALAEDPEDGDLAGYLAAEHARAKRWQAAEELGKKHLVPFLAALDRLGDVALKPSPIQLASVYATCQLARGDAAGALESLTQAARRCPAPHPNLLFLEGVARERTGDLPGAERCLRACLAMAEERFTIPVHPGATGDAARLRLANVLLQCARPREALKQLDGLGGKLALSAALARIEGWLLLGDTARAQALLAPILALPAPPADLFALASWAGVLAGTPDPALEQAARTLPRERWHEPRRRARVEG